MEEENRTMHPLIVIFLFFYTVSAAVHGYDYAFTRNPDPFEKKVREGIMYGLAWPLILMVGVGVVAYFLWGHEKIENQILEEQKVLRRKERFENLLIQACPNWR